MDVPNFAERLARHKSPLYEQLREAQAHVLESYAADHLEAADAAIQLPTGVGKTLIALLIADWALDNGRAVAYLTGTNQLADQVLEQARALPGLVIHRFSGGRYPGAALDDYHQAQAIGLMNYWVYFNSRPRVQPADLLILDDAHLAEQPITDMFTLRIARRRASELYEQVCDLVLAHSDSYVTLQSMRDGSAPPGTPPELIAFNDWSAVAGSVAAAIERSGFAEQDEARFVWPELRGRLTRCGVLIAPAAIEIRPYHPPTLIYPGYRRAHQRLYMSATLGTMDDLQRRLGVGPITGISTPPDLHLGATGRRLFLLNPTAEPALSEDVFGFAISQADHAGRVAWLCSSHAEADTVQELLLARGRSTFRLQPGDDAALEQWRESSHGHLVAAGRFDGLDLAGDVCRLVILPSVPAASSEFERFVVAYLGDAAFMRHRVGQRVTQALGRANRVADDWALYLGLDPSFAGMLAQPAVRNAIPAEVGPTIRRALELHDQGWLAMESAAARFWDGLAEPEPAAVTRPGRVVAGSHGAASATAEVEASTGFWLGDFPQAARKAGEAAQILSNAGEAEHAAFWTYVESHAHFSEGGRDHMERAKGAIQRAIANGPRTAWFVRLRHTLEELRGRVAQPESQDDLFMVWDEWLREGITAATNRVVAARGMIGGTHDQQVEAVLVLGRLAGANADRPAGQSAADASWVWVTPSRTERRLWEVKTGLAHDAVSRAEINQVLGQLSADGSSHRTRLFGCLLTPHDHVDADAAAASLERIAIVNSRAAISLFEHLADRFRAYAGLWGSGTAAERGSAREAVEARLPRRGWLERLMAPTQGRVRLHTEVDAEFD
jgi:hypothetical protein